YINQAGLVTRPIPPELFGELRRRRLVICGKKLLPPNIEGLESRWFVTTDPESARRITTALSNLRRMRGDACRQTK
ncbi:MAG: hypothetical protein R3C28_33760, partial [Pirellulaceae bacterium]